MSPIKTVLCMAPYQTLFMNSPKPKCIKHEAKNFMDSPEQKKYGWPKRNFFMNSPK